MTAIHVLLAEIDKVLLAEAPFCLNAGGHRFGERHDDAGLSLHEEVRRPHPLLQLGAAPLHLSLRIREPMLF
jgi:hypothetical protein